MSKGADPFLALLALAAYVAARCAVPLLPALPRGLNELLSVAVSVWLVLAVLYWWPLSTVLHRHRVLVLALAALAWVGMVLVGVQEPAVRLLVRVAQDACLLAVAASAASLVLPLLREASILVPIVGAAAVADALYVMVGPTQTIVSKVPNVASKIAASIPSFGMTRAPGLAPQALLVGPGDLIMIAFLFAACWRFELRSARTFVFTGIAVCVALLIVVVSGLPLPGWFFLAIAFLAANHGAIKLSQEEKRMLYVALAIGVAVLMAAGIFVASQ